MRLFDLYRLAVDEYRFQVDLNWKRTQSRDHMVRLGKKLHLGDNAIATTPGAGAAMTRWGSVTSFTTSVLVLLGVINIVGLCISIASFRA